MTESNSPWPEHVKLEAVSKESQAIGQFLEGLNERGYGLAKWNDDAEDYVAVNIDIETLLAEHFDIDMNKIEQEKRAMLEQMRGHHV